MDPRVIVVAAVADNNVIGDRGKIPWHLPADMNRFKTLTAGQTVIMGRRTWESLPPRFRPLPGRHNIVLTGRSDFRTPGAEQFRSLTDALAFTKGRTVFIIGGERVYREALPLADELRLTHVHDMPSGDAFFPGFRDFSFNTAVTLVDNMRFPRDEKNQYNFSFAIYRKQPLQQQSPVYLGNARKPDQWANMERIELDGVCPFCPDNLMRYHTPPVIAQNAFWVATENQWPYDNTRIHILLISKKHTESLRDISDVSWSALGELVSHLEDVQHITGGGLVLRFGNPALNFGTVRHLHFHLVSAKTTDASDPTYAPIRFRIG